jgi:aspartate aminotransferase
LFCLDERVGNLTFVVSDPSTITPVKSQVSLIIRANWSNPPAHGARIVAMILTTPEYRKQWFEAIQVRNFYVLNYLIILGNVTPYQRNASCSA